jgi:hypothetical protein
MQLGPVCFAVTERSQAARRPFDHRLIVRETAFRLNSAQSDPGIQEIYRTLAEDESRNRLILDDVLSALDAGRSPILLTERRDHLEYFAQRLRGFVRHLVVLQGSMSVDLRLRRSRGAGAPAHVREAATDLPGGGPRPRRSAAWLRRDHRRNAGTIRRQDLGNDGSPIPAQRCANAVMEIGECDPCLLLAR